MKKILKILIALVLVAASLSVAMPVPVSAQSINNCPAGTDPLLCPETGGEAKIQERVGNVLRAVYTWVGVIAVVVIVISGIRYMTSQGNAETVKKAKAGIMYAVIGLIIVLAAFAITELILSAL